MEPSQFQSPTKSSLSLRVLSLVFAKEDMPKN